MAATLSLPLKDRVLRDESGNHRYCQRCTTPRLATTPYAAARGRVEMVICDDHARAAGIDPLSPESIIRGLDICGMALDDIARCCDTTVERVMQVLGADYYCADCGRPAKWTKGVTFEYADGDIAREFWSTGCCRHWFIDKHGNQYDGPGPFAEGY